MTAIRWLRFFLLIGVVAVTTVGCTAKKPSGSSSPDFSATDLDGKAISYERYRGKVLVINYFATWCPPCKAEIPDFIAAYKEHKEQGLELIGVAVGEKPSDVEKFVEQQGINYPVIAGDEEMENKFGAIRSIPVTVVIDRDGNVADKSVGMLSREKLQEIIEPLLAAEGT